MSKASQEFNEQVLDAVYERLSLNESVPLISSGGSMGGMTALNYLICGKRRVIGCALNCAVTDMNKIFEDFPTYRRAILSAHITEDGALSDIMRRYSPVGFVDKLPEIPYFFVYGENDPYFTKNQMPPIIEMFEERGLEFEVTVQPGMRHCDIESHPEAFSKYCEFITAIGSRNF